jgi:hypothetical protein
MSVSLGDMCDDPETLIHSSSIDWMEQFRRASMLFSISIRRAILCHTYKQQSGGWSGGSWWDFEDEVQEPRTWLPGSSVGPAAGQGTTKHFTTQHDILQQIHFQPYHTHQNTRPGPAEADRFADNRNHWPDWRGNRSIVPSRGLFCLRSREACEL